MGNFIKIKISFMIDCKNVTGHCIQFYKNNSNVLKKKNE